ncbi:hypothetical protein INS49_009954 [Diaporthe citri]|uniref:uncharacterized protein n=1 Tax=Diaporthe citri TaxID=83186 RepID=UPI001C7E48C8|nr:uncharacterized protein INS49_009954 [Diaporthe citri]KAG6361726.1 hypothetical protein INS49_009954 [Diaporthe citri]
MYGATGGAKVKNREGVPAPDQMRVGSCRALYIPKHNGNMKGVLPVYDFTQGYSDKLRDENIGSDKWRYTLGLMRKPQGDGKDGAEVAYLVDVEEFNNAAEKQVINWQIHPVEHGPLRYTLVELPSPDQDASAVEPENQHRIKAIYHNVGVGTSLVQPFSEGVLLLPASRVMDADPETVVLTSLIGLLWKARGVPTVKLDVPAAREDFTKPKSRKSGSFFRKSWNDKREDDVIR